MARRRQTARKASRHPPSLRAQQALIPASYPIFKRAGSFPTDPPSLKFQKYRYSGLPEGGYIRLLELAPGSQLDPVSVRLFTTKLSDAPEYSAISYVWGDRRVTAPLDCGSGHLNITVNLRDALVKVRQKHVPATIWADAVCINQSDLRERGHQVSLMGTIYQRASKVLICLGPEDREGNACHVETLLKDVESLISAYPSFGQIPALEPEDSLYSDPRWVAVKSMLDQPWFYRAWVIQEVGLAKLPMVLYGESSFRYESLMRMGLWSRNCALHIYVMISLDLHITWSCNWESTAGNNDPQRGMVSDLGSSLRNQRSLTFLDLLNHTRGLGCADPKDHVYAFLGHPLARINGDLIIVPDYRTVTYIDMYKELACNLVKRTETAHILSAAEHTNESILEKLPSWIPCWDISQTLDPLGIDSRHYYNSTASVTPTMAPKVTSNYFLRLQGIAIDRIEHFIPLPFTKSADLDGTREKSLELRRYGAAIRILWEELSIREQLRPSQSKHSMAELLSLTLTAGKFGDQPAEGENLQAHLADFAAFWVRNCEDAAESCFPELEHLVAEGDEKRFGYSMRLVSAGRGFIITTKGSYGLGPYITQPGDNCFVVYGTTVPYILRATKHRLKHKLVGEAYINGFMRGEAIEYTSNGELTETDIIIC